jgi:anaerobic dimethyl sulfoxide reductase subunit B (iron-sulfur subunit)
MTYIFTFDASACSGCKTCQEACKDKNELPVGVLWRRVFEVSGGEWKSTGRAWENSVFAYNLTLACNHCRHPKCAGVCPTDAYTVRPDGIVLLDSSRCMGCGYCAWACPYDAPQYDGKLGVMTKCNFCYDNLDAGLPPTCVSACPLRVLEYGTIEALSTFKDGRNLWQLPATEHPFPLPNYSRTEPRLAIKPHIGMKSPLEKTVSNREEIQSGRSSENKYRIPAFRELPLVAFSLLAQMAAGMAASGLVISPLPQPVLLTIGILLGIGGLISFLHLGRKPNAWRSVIHIKKSWLSREILMAGLFGVAWLLTVGSGWLHVTSAGLWLMAILGFGLVYSMSQVYLLRAVPVWNSWRTPAAFFLSAITLGVLGVNLAALVPDWGFIVGLALAAEMGLALTARPLVGKVANKLRLILLGLGIMSAVLTVIFPQASGLEVIIPVFVIVLAGEAIGRWQFYAERLA